MLEDMKNTVLDVFASKYGIIALLVILAAIFALRGELLVTVALLVIAAPIYVLKD